jgi:tetratricopeptide (TPR) repeat protein
MKNSRFHFFVLVLIILIPVKNIAAQSGKENPNALLEGYLETGSVEYLEKINEYFPDSPYSMFCEAYEYIDIDKIKARELAEALITSHPDFAPGYFALGTLLVSGYKEYEEAINQFNISVELDNKFGRNYQNRGIAYLGKGDYSSAWDDFNQLINIKRGYALGYILRGVANHGKQMNEDFLADFEIGLQIDHQALASIFSTQVSEALDKAIESTPENIIYLYARGYANFVNGNYRIASADFTKAIAMVPGSSDFYKYSGACKLFLDDSEGAQTDLNIALGSNPDDPEIYYYLGVLMNDVQDQPSRANEYLNNAIELDNQNGDYYFERSKSLYEMNSYEAALNDINLALELNHRKGDFYALRGHIKMKLGNSTDDCCKDYYSAVEWGTSYNLKRILKKTCK